MAGQIHAPAQGPAAPDQAPEPTYRLTGKCWHVSHSGALQLALCEALRACRAYVRSHDVRPADLNAAVAAYEADQSGDPARQRAALVVIRELRARVGVLEGRTSAQGSRMDAGPTVVPGVHAPRAPAALTLAVQEAPELGDHPDDLIVFDTETTGRARDSRIVDLAAVRVRPGRGVLDRFEELVDPGLPMPPEVITIHGITDDMVRGARSIGPVLADFFAFTRTSTLVAHSASFDVGRVRYEAARVGLALPDVDVLDSLAIARRAWPALPSHALAFLRAHLELADRGHHRAMPDVLMLLDVLRLARGELGKRGVGLRDAHGPALRLRETAGAGGKGGKGRRA